MDRSRARALALCVGAWTVASGAGAQDTAFAQDRAARLPFAAAPGGPAVPALDEAALAAQRGAAAVTNIVETRGTLSNTSATQVMTGANTVSEGSFGNASGLATVIQNTGANVLIQNATIVNVQFK